MSVFQILKSRLALSKFLRNPEGRFFSAAPFKATPPVHQCNKLAPKIEGHPCSCVGISDAFYNDASIVLIVFPLLASSLILPILAREIYIHNIAEWWCETDGKVEKFEYRKRLTGCNLPLFGWLSPFR
jgi:hypothetical protein